MKQLFNKTVLIYSFAFGCLTFSAASSAALALSDVPLFIKDGVDPNIIVTLDDSGSMAWGYVPDGMYSYRNTNRFKAASFNAMYYDPTVTYTAPKKADGTSYTTSFTSAYVNGFVTSQGTVDLSNSYKVTYQLNPNTGSNYTLGSNAAAFYYVYDSTLSTCSTPNTNDDNCYKKVTVGSSEEQNFANWYSFYRVRVLATASAASLGFQSLSGDVRVAWQNLHSCNGFDTSCQDWNGNTYDSRVRPFTGTHRSDFYNWLQYAPASGGTPLRSAFIRAGNLLKSTGLNSPYAKDPGTTQNPMYACRATYHIAMTDGLWNSDSISAYGNYDNNNTITTPGGCDPNATGSTCPSYTQQYPSKTFTPSKAPFSDSSSNSLADIAFSQWINDAQPTIDNEVPTYVRYTNTDKDVEYWDPRNDPAEWQHMVTFTVGLGLTTSLTDPDFTGNTFGGDYSALASGTKSWPSVSSDSANNPYDLWHAAINGRGEFFSADSPNALVDAFTSIIAGIQNRQASAAAVALDSGSISGLNYAYTANFQSSDWSGDVQAYALDPVTHAFAATPSWHAQTQLDGLTWSTRNIKTKGSTGSLVNFTWANLSSSQQTLLNKDINGNTDTKGSNRVDYIRGNRSLENNNTGFRVRNHVLGDIVNSGPIYVGAPSFYDLDTLENISATAANSYASFKTNHASRQGMVFVGANDGMLHGFNADTGAETFAFVPSQVYDHLTNLTAPTYTHKFYVDGPSVSSDVYFNNSWHTILVGTLRQGGKEVYALDITDPTNISLLWEYTNADLGYVYGKPVITRLHNGRWGVIIGNGYNSTSQVAKLFVLDAQTGGSVSTNMAILSTGVGSTTSPNGLAGPTAVDINGDLITDYVYAGDLKGNLWRFNLIDTSSASPIYQTSTVDPRNNAAASTWRVAYGGNPLFVAKDAASPVNLQPITVAPRVIRHPTGTGHLVVFGTGKYLEASDASVDTVHVQSLYGVWDRYTHGEVTTASNLNPVIQRSNMQAQTISSGASISNTTLDYRTISQNSFTWYSSTNTTGKLGWYIDFKVDGTANGEFLVSDPLTRANVMFFTTTTPNDDPCQAGTSRSLWGIDARTGAQPTYSVFDINGDRSVDSLDQLPDPNCTSSSCSKFAPAVIHDPSWDTGLGSPTMAGDIAYLNEANGGGDQYTSTGAEFNFRQSWKLLK